MGVAGGKQVLGKLPALSILDMRNNRVTEISPGTLKKMTALTKLMLRYNRIVALPAEVGHLKNLQLLSIRNNHLISVPPVRKTCPPLAGWLLLDAVVVFTTPPSSSSDDCLCPGGGWPQELNQLEKLQVFDARGNQLRRCGFVFLACLYRLRFRAPPRHC
jgi:Leucine-rich repeat (LRR) protein